MNKSLQQLLSLKGKTAVVTGGAGYLGTAISETLAELGANLVLASRDRAKCQQRCEEIVQQFDGSVKAVAFELDVLKKGAATEFFAEVHQQFPAIDILVNNAWSGKKNSWESITEEDWEYDINMSLNSVFRMTKAAFPDLKTTRGVILNIGSLYSHLAPDYRMYDGKEFANPPSYGAAKAGVIQFTKYLSSFLSPHGIRVNALSPGAYPHPPTQKHTEFMQRLASKNPLNRIGQPDDLKGAVALLCSDAGRYITGQDLHVDGGWGVW
ncbi:MAG: SDR family oxidoreductase [Terriglobales bacterium]|jgi:gluconate 5-dehydrogenase